jgi:TetR/AcrR family fatty acid metabolism transcriptional regulator
MNYDSLFIFGGALRTREGNKEQDIINAAMAVFGEKGFNDAKMHHIAEKAGIGTGTVYLYFKNKEEILLRTFELVWSELHALVAAIKADSALKPTQKLSRLIDSVFDYFAKDLKLSTVLINQQKYLVRSRDESSFHAIYARTLEKCESIIAEGQKAGVFNASIRPIFFQSFFFGGIRNSLWQWANAPDVISLDELRADIKTVLMAGITASKEEN